MTTNAEVAVVSGAGRGLGREVARQLAGAGLIVVATARRPEAAAEVGADLGTEHHPVDVTSGESVAALAAWVRERFGRVDVLVNNAGVNYDTGQRADRADLAVVEEALAVNVVGAWRLAVALRPLMGSGSRIVNVSSGAGSFAENDGAAGTPAYAVSKAALDMLTVKLAADCRGAGILVNAVCPGWVATDMGGAGGRPVPDGAAGIVWAATEIPDGVTGAFFGDGERIPW